MHQLLPVSNHPMASAIHALLSAGIQKAVRDFAQCWHWSNSYAGETTGEIEFFQKAYLREISKFIQIICRTRPVFYLELQLGNPSLLLSLGLGELAF